MFNVHARRTAARSSWLKYLLNRLVGLVVKASGSRAENLDSIPAFFVGIFPGRVIPVT